MRIAVAGSSGLLGTRVVNELHHRGHQVLRLVRRPANGAGERQWDPGRGKIQDAGLDDVDAVINFCGAGIADARWTPQRKDELRSSRVTTTRTLVSHLRADGRCQRLLNGSAVGFYGNSGEEIRDEDSPAGTGYLADLVVEWEASAADAPVATTHLRTGQVLTPTGGYLGKQWLPFKLGLGGRIGDGRQFVSWIHQTDYGNAVLFLLSSAVTGPVNLVGPNPVTNEEFTRQFAAHLKRPALMPIPTLALRVLFGSELVEEALLSGTRALPRRLLDSGFSFTRPHLAGALGDLS
ncbi:MAG: TIGR01777 family oxidoreductase [Micropruina sp.]